MAHRVLAAMAARPPRPRFINPIMWPWMQPVIYTLLIRGTIAFAKWAPPVSLLPLPGLRQGLISQEGWLLIQSATFTLQMCLITEFAKWTLSVLLRLLPGMVLAGMVAMAARPLRRRLINRIMWLWTQPATCSSLILTIIAFVKWTPPVLLLP